MNHLKKSAWHEPEADEFRRYLKEKNVLQALQPGLTLLYKLPVKPTNLHEFFAEYLENGANTLVKLSLLRAEHCYIKNELHVMKTQMRQLKERIQDAEAIVRSFQTGANPLQNHQDFEKFSLIDRFVTDVNQSFEERERTPSEILLEIENELDDQDDDRREFEPIRQFIEDHQQIDPMGLLFDFRPPDLEEDEEQDEEEDEKFKIAETKKLTREGKHRSRSIFKRATSDAFQLDDFGDEDDEEGLLASALTHGRLAIGLNRLHDKRREERRLLRKPDGNMSGDSSETSESHDDDRGYDSGTSMLNLFDRLQLPSRASEDKSHRKLLRVLHAKKLRLLSGGKDWLPLGKNCAEVRQKARHKERKTKNLAEGKLEKIKKSKQSRKNRDKGYHSIGIDPAFAKKERFNKLLNDKPPNPKEEEEDEAFLKNFGPKRWSISQSGRPLTHSAKLKTNADFLFEFPLEDVLQAQKWIDDTFNESVWHLNEPLALKENLEAFDGDDEDNYVWLEDYLDKDRLGVEREINDANLPVERKVLDKIHAGIKRERRKWRKEKSCQKRSGVKGDKTEMLYAQIPDAIMEESDLRKTDVVASVPSLLKAHRPSRKGEMKRSERTKQYVQNMFDDQYRKKLMNQFQFDMLDDD